LYYAGNPAICPGKARNLVPAGEKDRSPTVEESAPLPQVETVAQVTEATPLEDTMVDGTYTVPMSFTSSVVVAPDTDFMYFVVIETQVEGTAIPEAVAIEGVVPEADVLGGATSSPEVPIAPEITEEVHDDALPESSIVVRSPEIQDAEPICSAPSLETSRREAQPSIVIM
jgi:hypothetical protein